MHNICTCLQPYTFCIQPEVQSRTVLALPETRSLLMQEATTFGPRNALPRDVLSGQSLLTLLALVGTKRVDMETLRERTKLTPFVFENLLAWLQREYLVDVITSLEGDQVKEGVTLTERGEAALVRMLESTCELPELR